MSENKNTKKYDELENTFFSLLPRDILIRVSLFINPPPVYTHEVLFMSFQGGRIPYSIQFKTEEDALKFQDFSDSLGYINEYHRTGIIPKKKKICHSIEDAISQMENETNPALGSASLNGYGISCHGSLLRKKIEEDERELKKQKTEK